MATDSAADSIEKIASQYESSQVFKKWLNSYLNERNYLCAAICSFADFFDVDKASGKWLTVLGRIVGQPRLPVDSSNLPIFGFEDGGGDNFGFNEGVFTDGTYGTVNVDSNDAIYRRMIKARVLKNASNCSLNDIVKSIIILGERDDFEFVDIDDPMQLSINYLTGDLDDLSKSLITDYNLLPLACGVKLIDIVSN